MKKVLLFPILVAMVGCSSAQQKPAAQEEVPDRVVSRIDGMESRPTWVKESEPFKVEGGEATSLGSTTIPADHRLEAAYRIAENNAKAGIASTIEQRLDYVFQQANEGTSLDADQVRFIGAEASQLTTSSIHPGKRYYEKVITTTASGETKAIYRVFATVQISEPELKRAVLDAVRKAQGKEGLSAEFSKQVAQHWDRFTGNTVAQKESQSSPKERAPASLPKSEKQETSDSQ